MKDIVAGMALLLLLPMSGWCQISGKVISEQNEAVPFANVLLLLAADSSLHRGAITDEAGAFSIQHQTDDAYLLQFSTVGFETLNLGPLTLGPGVSESLGEIVLKTSNLQLADVVVEAEKPLFQQDMGQTIVNVASSLLSKGSSALQVLERSPGVQIDRRDNQIMFNGKNGVLVMINGKPMRVSVSQVVQMLNGMSANNIEKIELLTSPPAGFDAEGSAGIINIVLKKGEGIGTHGTVSATAGYGWAEKATASADWSHGTGRSNFFGNYAFSHDNTHSSWFATGSQDMPALGGPLDVDFLSTTNRLDNNHLISIGFDTQLNNTIMAGNLAYNNSRSTAETVNEATYLLLPDSLTQMTLTAVGRNNWQSLMADAFVEQRLGENDKISFETDILNYWNDAPIDASAAFYDSLGKEVIPEASAFSSQQQGRSKTPIEVRVARLDYQRSINATLQLDAGIKGTYTFNTSNSSITTVKDTSSPDSVHLFNSVDMNEYIGASYADLRWTPSDQNTLHAGVRYEYSHTGIDADRDENQVRRKISKLFPSVQYSRQVGEHTSLEMSFNKRIARPSYNDLASSLRYNDPTSVFTGNPALRPTITTNLKFGVTHKGYLLSALLSHDNFPIARFQLLENQQRDLMYVQPVNMISQDNLILQLHTPIDLTPWWHINLNLLGGWRRFKLEHTQEQLEKVYPFVTVSGSQTFELPRQFHIELSGWYNSVSYDGSKKLGGFGMANLGVAKTFENKSSLQLSVTDLLQSMTVYTLFGSITREAYDLTSTVKSRSETAWNRIIKVTYTCSFGQDGNSNRRTNRAGEERGRVRR
jgi:iron complex outermembrane recepter protein